MVERADGDPGMMTALVRSERNGVTLKSDLVDPSLALARQGPDAAERTGKT